MSAETPPPVRAGLYIRISRDPRDQRKGVARQLLSCQALADRLGWTIVGTYDENNVSATSGKARPEYQRLLRDVISGDVTGIVIAAWDRATRSVTETETLLDLARDLGLRAASTSGGEIDLTTAQGRFDISVTGAAARREAEVLGERVTAAFAQQAAAGRPHGRCPWGWRRVHEHGPGGAVVSSKDRLEESEAAIVRESIEALLGGSSMRAVARDLADRDLRSPDGKPWNAHLLRQVLTRPRNCGRAVYQGKVLEGVTGDWEPIVSADVFDALMALLADHPRYEGRGGRDRKYMLTGLALCPLCPDGGPIEVNAGRVPLSYYCRGCKGLRRRMDLVDAVVESYMIKLLSRPGALDAVGTGDPAEVARARQARDAAIARMQLAADEFGGGRWSADQVARVNTAARAVIDAAEATIAANLPPALPGGMTGTGARASWAAASLEQRRVLIKLLVTVTILPVGPGRAFDPSRIRIEQRRTV